MPRTRTKKQQAPQGLSDIVSLVFMMGQFMREKMHRNLKQDGCSFLEFEALRYVKEAGEPLMRDIAVKFHVTPPAATLLIDGLVKRHMLERRLDPSDRRSVRIGLTREGKRFLDRGMARKVRELKKLFGVLTGAERTQFSSILKKIIQ
jgi:DNA-binding MarR family transcriptional regulator